MDLPIFLILVMLLVGAVCAYPSWPYATGQGYYPSGIIAALLIVILVLMLLFGAFAWPWAPVTPI